MSTPPQYLHPVERACFHHPDRRTRDACDCCGKPICQECSSTASQGKRVCSDACRDRLIERDKEMEEFNRLPSWPTRIWTSAFLILLLGSLGGLGGCYFCFRGATRSRRNIPASEYYFVIKVCVIVGAFIGVVCAIAFLYRYYKRKL